MVHKQKLHQLTMTRTFSKESYLNSSTFLSDMLADIHDYLNCFHLFYFLLSNLSKILHVEFLVKTAQT